jgi:hypothetical protein
VVLGLLEVAAEEELVGVTEVAAAAEEESFVTGAGARLVDSGHQLGDLRERLLLRGREALHELIAVPGG